MLSNQQMLWATQCEGGIADLSGHHHTSQDAKKVRFTLFFFFCATRFRVNVPLKSHGGQAAGQHWGAHTITVADMLSSRRNLLHICQVHVQRLFYKLGCAEKQ